MRPVLVSILLCSSAAMAEGPVVNAKWCAARHERLAAVDRTAIEVLKRWNLQRRRASQSKTTLPARRIVETTAILDRLLEVGQQASDDAARCTAAGFRSTPAQRAAYRRNEVDFRQVELVLATLHDSWVALMEPERETLMAEVKKSGVLETL